MTTKLFRSSRIAVFASLLLCIPVANAALIQIPAPDGSTPNVLSPFDFSITVITLTFSQPLSVFGLEAEPDALTQGTFPVSMVFFNGGTQLGTLNNVIDGTSAALFAAGSTTPIT